MTKKEKRLQKMRQNPREVTFDELIHVLEDYGFIVRPGKGSHYSARAEIKNRVTTLTFAKPHSGQKHIHPVRVKKAIQYVDEIESESNDG